MDSGGSVDLSTHSASQRTYNSRICIAWPSLNTAGDAPGRAATAARQAGRGAGGRRAAIRGDWFALICRQPGSSRGYVGTSTVPVQLYVWIRANYALLHWHAGGYTQYAGPASLAPWCKRRPPDRLGWPAAPRRTRDHLVTYRLRQCNRGQQPGCGSSHLYDERC